MSKVAVFGLDIAKAAQFSAPMTAAALQQFIAAAGMGFGREDDAAWPRSMPETQA